MSRLSWLFAAALFASRSSAFAQATQTPVPSQTLQAGETLSVDEEITTTTNTSLQVSGGTVGQGPAGGKFTPPPTSSSIHTRQTIQILNMDSTAHTTSVSTPGMDLVAADQQSSTSNYKLTCADSSHFDATALVPTPGNDAVLEETCEMLERIDGTTAFLNKARAAALSDKSNAAHVLLPLVADMPKGTWTLTLNPAAPAGNVFDLLIQDVDPSVPVWKGSLETNSSDDEIAITLQSETTSPMADKAPNGDVVNANVKKVVKWHRKVTRQVPAPANTTTPTGG